MTKTNNDWATIIWREDDLKEAIEEEQLNGIDIQKLMVDEKFARKFKERCIEEGWEVLKAQLLNQHDEIKLLHAIENNKQDWIGKEISIAKFEKELEKVLNNVCLYIVSNKLHDTKYGKKTKINFTRYTYFVDACKYGKGYIGYLDICFNVISRSDDLEKFIIKLKSIEVE